MAKTYLTTVLDPFNPENRETIEIEAGQSVYSLLKDLNYDIEVYEPVIGKNQDIIETDFIIEDGDHVVFCLVPRGGGNARKVWQVVAMIVIAVVSYGVGSAYGIGYGIAVGVAGGLAVSLLLPPQMPSSNFGNTDVSQNYGWDSQANALQQGISLPILYGKTKITPPIIGKYLEAIGDKQYLHVLYALCEGEISSIEDIKVNKDSIEYFKDVNIDLRLGTNEQEVIPYFTTTISDKFVGRKVSFEEYIITQTDGNTVSYLGLNLLFPKGLWRAMDDGSLGSTTVYIVADYRGIGTEVWIPFPETWGYGAYGISGKTSQQTRRTLKVNVDAGQYEVRVKFYQQVEENARYGNDCYFEFLGEGISDEFTYPNTALLSIRALATDQLSGQMPLVTVVAERLSGSTELGGNLSNPAWACYDLLVNARYGAGVLPERIDYASFENWAAWCEEQNFTCNLYIDSISNLRKTLDIISQLGRGVIIQYGSKFSCIVERPALLPTQGFLFGMGNIVKDSFKEEFLPLSDRTNIVEITYYDKELDYDRSVIEVAQGNYDLTNEVNTTSITLLGCTDKQQAIRHAKFLLNCNRYLTITATWEADIDAIHCRVGDIVNVAHDVPDWGQSGRIKEVTKGGIYLDRVVSFDFSKPNFLQITDKNTDEQRIIEVLYSAEQGGNYVDFASEPEFTIELLSNYSFGTIERITKQMRIIKIITSSELRRKITAIEYIKEVYDDNAEIVIPELPNPQEVKNLTVSETAETLQGGAKIYNLSLIWQGYDFFYNIWYKNKDADEWILAGQTYDTRYLIRNVTVGQTYDIAVGRTFANSARAEYTVLGDMMPPVGVILFFIDYIGGEDYNLKWKHIEASIDIAGYEIRKSYGISNDWNTGQKIHEGFLTSSPYPVKLKNGIVTFFIKAVNNASVYSDNFAKIIYNVTNAPAVDNLIERIDFHTDWIGVKENASVESGKLVAADCSAFWGEDSAAFWQSDNSLFWRDGFYMNGSFVGNFTVEAAGYCWFESAHNKPINVYYRKMDSSGEAFWGEDGDLFWEEDEALFWVNAPLWIPFLTPFTINEGDYQIKIEFWANDDIRAEVDTLSVFIDAPDVVETFNDVFIPILGKTIIPTKNFRVIKTVLLTLQSDGGNAASGKVAAKNPQPIINLYDIGGTAASGTVDIEIRGY